MNINLSFKGMVKWPQVGHVSYQHHKTEAQSKTGTETIITCIETINTRQREKGLNRKTPQRANMLKLLQACYIFAVGFK